jgi:hypothetical protein
MLGAMADGGIFLNRMRWCVPVVLLAACAHKGEPDSSPLGAQKSALTYTEQQKLYASDPQANDRGCRVGNGRVGGAGLLLMLLALTLSARSRKLTRMCRPAGIA